MIDSRRILYVTPELPYFPGGHGGNIREFHLLRHLAEAHFVDVLALSGITPERRVEIERLGATVLDLAAPAGNEHGSGRRISREARWISHLIACLARGGSCMAWPSVAFRHLHTFRNRAYVSAGGYDMVQLEHTYLLPIARHILAADVPPPVAVTAHNVESLMNRRLLGLCSSPIRQVRQRLNARLANEMERGVLPSIDVVFTMSNHDSAWITEAFGIDQDRVVVVPNGVDAGHFERTASPIDSTVVFTGSFGHPPNADAVRWFRSDMMPAITNEMPAARFLYAGSTTAAPGWLLSVGSKSSDREEFQFDVPDMRLVLQRGCVYIAPLRAGSGTRLKILEAMAAYIPVVATSMAAEGLDVDDGIDIILADTPGEFSAAVVRLLNDPSARKRLADNALRLVRTRFDWSRIAGIQLRAYERFWPARESGQA